MSLNSINLFPLVPGFLELPQPCQGWGCPCCQCNARCERRWGSYRWWMGCHQAIDSFYHISSIFVSASSKPRSYVCISSPINPLPPWANFKAMLGSHTFLFKMEVPMVWGISMGSSNPCSTLTHPPNIPWLMWWVWVYHGCGCGYNHQYPGVYPCRCLHIIRWEQLFLHHHQQIHTLLIST